MLPSAERLTGLSLEGGWRVIAPVLKDHNSTGGHFSKCYIVENANGKKAFLKAMDFSEALKSSDPARHLQALTEAFNFERDVLHKCKNENLDHVVIAINDGTIRLKDAYDGGVVQYLIFELADGDVRRQADLNEKFDIAWSLRSLHNIAVGLQQIHGHGIAHQDLKPSNVLVFEKNSSKIADFGRSAYKGHTPPHEDLFVAGDLSYAPPELLYGYIDPDWNRRRFGCDTYLLGSMAVFFFSGIGTTPLIFNELPDKFLPRNWGGVYEDVLPYLDDAFQRVLSSYRCTLPKTLQKDMVDIVSQLCAPAPNLRGHPKNRKTNQFSLERYISKFNLLAIHAENGILHLLPL